MPTRIFHPQAADLAGMVEDHTSGCVAGVEGQRDINNGMPAGPPRRRVSCALEAAAKAGHAGPRACDLIRIRVASLSRADRDFLQRAIDISRRALKDQGKTPFGAIVVVDQEIVGEGTSSVVELLDPSAHAEIMALRSAAAKLQRHLIDDGTRIAAANHARCA